jgi:protein SCO1/2
LQLALAVLVLLLGGCAPDTHPRGQLRGTVLPEPIARPQFTLPDLSGEPYPFAERTAGKLTFLFFGYTYCPDVCPVHMASLAAALRGLPYEDRQRVAVVFVTVDPERDSPERLREWLGAFDPRFVGLRGSVEEANAATAQLNFPPAVREPGGGENYTVGHAASVIAFSPEGPARVLYPFGTRREDWVHDLPILLGHEEAQALSATSADRPQPVAPGGALQVVRAFVTHSRMAQAAALYAIIENRTSSTDTLVAVDAPAGRTELHETVREGEGAGMRTQMRPVPRVAVPAGGKLRLAPGGYHVMLLQPALEWQPGDTVTAVFRFASGAVRTVQAPVVTHDEVERLLDERTGG